jgi:3-methylfumaryl-CoA hydratase
MAEDAGASSLLEEIGARERSSSSLARSHADLLADALDVAAPGIVLPALWHWAYFAPRVTTSALGEDGHPARPADGALAGLPRRMWAGGRLWFPGDLLIGTPAVRRTELVSMQHKQGRQGSFALVTLRHEIRQDAALCVIEEQDLVFRPPPGTTSPPEPPAPAEVARNGRSVARTISPTLLFRYAALTFNAHRIHHDLAYATEVEGYPGLVVQGPLVATLLAGLATTDGRALARFAFRASAPAFAPSELMMSMTESAAGGPDLFATRPDGVTCMVASAARR